MEWHCWALSLLVQTSFDMPLGLPRRHAAAFYEAPEGGRSPRADTQPCSAHSPDWGPEQLSADQRRDLLEIMEDRHDARSILITSQLPAHRWYEHWQSLLSPTPSSIASSTTSTAHRPEHA
jgi:hypothetical protein